VSGAADPRVASADGACHPSPVRIAIASSYGLSGREVERAFARGVSTFFWGALRHASFGSALRSIARDRRERITIATVSYARHPLPLRASVEVARRRLGLDSLDLLVLGYWQHAVPPGMVEAAVALRERGLVRRIGVSSHDRRISAALGSASWLDTLMTRYSAAHPGAEVDVFPHAGEKELVTYTATRWGTLLDRARIAGERVPTASDCYRFVLAHPRVDLCLAGPRDARELDGALDAAEKGPLDDAELAWMRRVGAAVRASAKDPAPRFDTPRRALAAVRSLLTHGPTEDVISRFNR
jgi:aryl-alcohol dehydrogenase-like predicted oxidoreductase